MLYVYINVWDMQAEKWIMQGLILKVSKDVF